MEQYETPLAYVILYAPVDAVCRDRSVSNPEEDTLPTEGRDQTPWG